MSLLTNTESRFDLDEEERDSVPRTHERPCPLACDRLKTARPFILSGGCQSEVLAKGYAWMRQLCLFLATVRGLLPEIQVLRRPPPLSPLRRMAALLCESWITQYSRWCLWKGQRPHCRVRLANVARRAGGSGQPSPMRKPGGALWTPTSTACSND
jgi:hypothetical protein